MKKVKCLISVLQLDTVANILKLINTYKKFWKIDVVSSAEIGNAYYIYVKVGESDLAAFGQEIERISTELDIFIDIMYTEEDYL